MESEIPIKRWSIYLTVLTNSSWINDITTKNTVTIIAKASPNDIRNM